MPDPIRESSARTKPHVTFSQQYPLGHSYLHTYAPTDYFCPHCGRRDVWEECSDGDYYQGPDILCLYCGGGFCLPNGDGKPAPDDDSPTMGPLHWIRKLTGYRAPTDEGSRTDA